MIPTCDHLTAWSRFASSKTSRGLLPPVSRVIALRFTAAAFMMALPVSVLPVKAILSTPTWLARVAPATPPAPFRMFTTPLGKPASLISVAR